MYGRRRQGTCYQRAESPKRAATPRRLCSYSRIRDNLRVAHEVGELVQDEPGIRDRPGIPGMTRKRKAIEELQPQPSPKRAMEYPEVSALRSPPQARTGLAKWSLIVDKPLDDQAP